MIKVETDTVGTQRVIMKANFDNIFDDTYEGKPGDFEHFTNACGIELKSAVLSAIVAAQDEYMRIVLSGVTDEQAEELKEELSDMMFSYMEDITEEEIEEFREKVLGQG